MLLAADLDFRFRFPPLINVICKNNSKWETDKKITWSLTCKIFLFFVFDIFSSRKKRSVNVSVQNVFSGSNDVLHKIIIINKHFESRQTELSFLPSKKSQ